MNLHPKRQSIRLKNHNYSSAGFYFVTICSQNRLSLFGQIVNDIKPVMVFNDAGTMIRRWWLKIPQRFKNVYLDEFQIMPNHLHGIIIIRYNNRTHGSNNRTHGSNGRTHGSNGRTHGSAPTGEYWEFPAAAPVGVDPRVDPNDPRVDPNDPRVDPNDRQKQLLFKSIQWFKTMTTNDYIRHVRNDQWKPFQKRLWQRNYYEHIIKNENNFEKIRQYIKINPQIWCRDRNNPNENKFSL